jgi:protocatechuate 3,4-dioxygenase beta subunit
VTLAVGEYLFTEMTLLSVSGQAPACETLITALYFPGDPYLTSDAVFGVKQSLVVVSNRVVERSI